MIGIYREKLIISCTQSSSFLLPTTEVNLTTIIVLLISIAGTVGIVHSIFAYPITVSIVSIDYGQWLSCDYHIGTLRDYNYVVIENYSNIMTIKNQGMVATIDGDIQSWIESIVTQHTVATYGLLWLPSWYLKRSINCSLEK